MHRRPGPRVPPQALALWPQRPPPSPRLSPLPAWLPAEPWGGGRGGEEGSGPSRNAFPEGASPLAVRSPPARPPEFRGHRARSTAAGGGGAARPG